MAFSRFTQRALEAKKKKGVCHLCLEQKPLIKKSHIIPEFMYQELYDENHKMFHFAPKELLKPKPIIKRPSLGIYEGGLLCADCDNKVIGQQYEDYVGKVLYSKTDLPPEIAWQNKLFKDPKHGLEFCISSNINYKKFKLFVLSILWRASISSNDFFSAVNLGPYEETIRKMIEAGEPGSDDLYPINVFSWLRDEKLPNDIISKPLYIKKDGKTTYYLPINGLLIEVSISKGPLKPPFDGIRLKEDGTMTIYELPKGSMGDLLKHLSNI